MRFERLSLPAFGPFTEVAFDFPAAGGAFHLVYGPAEAGKSSLPGDASSEDVEIAEQAVKNAKPARDLQITSSEMQVSGALGQFASAESLAQKQNMRAPFSGTITRRLSTEGSFVSPGTPLYSLSAPGETEIKLNVSKGIIEKLADNQKVSLFENDTQSSRMGSSLPKIPFPDQRMIPMASFA